MSRQYAGTPDLIWQPDLRISTFPSGLILAQRSAVGRVTNGYTDGIEVGDDITSQFPNVTNDGGIFVFPTPQRKDDPVFSTFDVSGYGRVSDVITELYEDYVAKAYSSALVPGGLSTRITGVRCVQQGVIAATEPTPFSEPENDGIISVYLSQGTTSAVGTSASTWLLESSTRTNYGAWDEFKAVWSTPTDGGSVAVNFGGTNLTVSW